MFRRSFLTIESTSSENYAQGNNSGALVPFDLIISKTARLTEKCIEHKM
jgi:hypothetical protein